uniref:Methyltransf_11 domain-containing protein n=1 Tax=Caenorhabditis tropicalis TaxID=1561998 RepID=A0A1I7TEL2_9PELO
MSISSENVEKEYVHSIYSRLATYQQKEQKPSSPRIWPRVRQFVDQQIAGSVILDVGCGEAKYTSQKCHVIGFDTCAEVLSSSRKENIELCLADAICIPIRDESVDAVLNVSVIHHLATTSRRRQVLQECARCLRIGGQMMVYAWAFEQPNGKFAAQDILVPWNMHETAIGGRLPKVKFHLNTTKEQRIIAASIPVNISDASIAQRWFSGVLNKVTSLTDQLPYFSKRCPNSAGYSNQSTPTGSVSSPIQKLPSAAPQFLPTTNSLISGIKRWSPMLGRRLASLLVPVEEQFGEELSQTIMRESITEAMATLREVTFYRFYHVFKEGELSDLVDSIDCLKVVSTSFEHGNWCVIAEKVPMNVIRP